MCAHYSARACAGWLRDSIQSHEGGMISSQVHSYGLGDDLDSDLANVVGDFVNKVISNLEPTLKSLDPDDIDDLEDP